MRFHRPILILSLALAIRVTAGDPVPPEILQEELREMSSLALRLDTENRSLREQLEALQRVNQRLSADLAACQAVPSTASGPSVAPLPYSTGSDPVPGASQTHPILSVSAEWHYLIVDGGSEHGVKPDSLGRVLRDGRTIARVRVTAVKPTQAVADVDVQSLASSGEYPRPGDQVAFP